MFRQAVTSTPLTSDVANGFFTNITGETYNGDNSFVATLRALLPSRMSEGDEIMVRFRTTNLRPDNFKDMSNPRICQEICNSYHPYQLKDTIVVHSFMSDSENNKASFAAVDKGFTSKYPGYERLEKVVAFYKKSFPMDCFANRETRSVIIFIDRMDMKKLHYLQIGTLVFLPWYFDPAKGVTADEMELTKSLKEGSPDKYNEYILKLSQKYDFRSIRIKQKLAGFETKYEKEELRRTLDQIRNYEAEIRRLNDTIGLNLKNMNDTQIRAVGLQAKIDSGSEESEIMDYFLANQKLVLNDVTEREMSFDVKDYLAYFDSEMADKYIRNRQSFVYDRKPSGVTGDDWQKFMAEIFVSETPRLKIRTCASYQFELRGNVHPNEHHRYDPVEFDGYLPNPHIDRYGCMGNYTRAINECLTRNDYISALEQSIASCKSLNWSDSTVMVEFIHQMATNNKKFMELPDGSHVSVVDAIKWLKAQEEKHEKTEEEAANV